MGFRIMPNCEGKALVSGVSFTWILILASNNFVGKSFENEIENHSVVSDSLLPHGLYSPWNSPGQNTGVDSHSLLQGIFLTQIVQQVMDRLFLLFDNFFKKHTGFIFLSHKRTKGSHLRLAILAIPQYKQSPISSLSAFWLSWVIVL